jgi:hypothetical protein
MRVTINCEKMNVWNQTRPWQMARWAMKGIVTSQKCNFFNGFEHKTHTPSCMHSKRCWLLCLCVRIAHRNSNVPSGHCCICHCQSSWTKPIFCNLHGHTKNIVYMMSLPVIQNACYINFKSGKHFCHFHRGADLETLRLFWYLVVSHITLSVILRTGFCV